jgi:hypothetical protein
MTTWQEYMKEEGHAPEWPYPIRYDQEQEIDIDVLVLGGGIAGVGLLSPLPEPLKVALVERRYRGATPEVGRSL